MPHGDISTHFAPPPFPVGIFPQMMQHPETVSLNFKEKFWAWSHDDFKISDADSDAPFMTVSSKQTGLDRPIRFYDHNEQHLVSVRYEDIHLHATYVAVTGGSEEKEIFRVRAEHKHSTVDDEMIVRFMNIASNQDQELVIRRDRQNRNFTADVRLWHEGP